ncbi:uncharacterized protein L969DRAFT_526824 [Mixia osmundae IAM 14324]|uniref:Inhibitor I9 domain-containing protein n=1 Tax=Mixia osmundae (strain CBS 9802 / IAM 14324 / JCM 22182 / KY 12970) TaxID=764103 RepID=G7E0F6_MIXOS|nr:uncharacterized protein L969DRAFT_526824 [Mixia osmundae IAM 14324]KEI38325.1 hypothetical protein L969DRAFT_526824 [Mixia osmundae IAM 14324]GAA96316.1 hypothetical protein E5Q_02982 [Mixia osmundae IAM 14324]
MSSYIVMFHDDTSDDVVKQTKKEITDFGGKINKEDFGFVLPGAFEATIPDQTFQKLQSSISTSATSGLKVIEPNGTVKIQA